MFHETFYQKTADGTRFVDVLKSRGIIPGIKVNNCLINSLGSLFRNSSLVIERLLGFFWHFFNENSRLIRV